ncbi:hypothetical protein TVH25_06150 [Rhodococcus sp. 7Tela_A2]|uniref:hypothetical protein n=1 Tax=Rhodococcus sp. 7Tela_A2 TaxID=3093744 RepID=UPI003BB69A1E
MAESDARVEIVRDYIVNDILPSAHSQWKEEYEKDTENVYMLRWITGRINAAMQVLQVIDKDAFVEQKALLLEQLGVDVTSE